MRHVSGRFLPLITDIGAGIRGDGAEIIQDVAQAGGAGKPAARSLPALEPAPRREDRG